MQKMCHPASSVCQIKLRLCKVFAAITSAPGDPYVSVHIRNVGDWTGTLYASMSAYAKKVEVTLLKALSKGHSITALHSHWCVQATTGANAFVSS